MVLSNTRYRFWVEAYEEPINVFQQGKVVIDNELNQVQTSIKARIWQDIKHLIGEESISSDCSITISSGDLVIESGSLVLEDGVFARVKEPVTVSASGGAGTYYLVATITGELFDYTDDDEIQESKYGSETIQLLDFPLTFSLQASQLSSRTSDSSLTLNGTEGSGATLKYVVDSTNSYTTDAYKWGHIVDSNGTLYNVVEQRTDQPAIGSTRFIIDAGPNQSAPTLTGADPNKMLQYPLPFYQPVNSNSKRYLVIGEATVNASNDVTAFSTTCDVFHPATTLYSLFDVEHFVDTGAHGPKVTIVQSTADNAFTVSKTHTGSNDAATISNAGTGDGLKITQTGAGIGCEVTQSGGNKGLLVQKSHSSSDIAVQITNQGTGNALYVQQNTLEATPLYVQKQSTGSSSAVQVDNSGTGPGIVVNQTAAGIGIQVNQPSSNDGILISKTGTGAGFALEVTHSGSSAAVRVSNTGAAEGINVDNSTGTYGVRVYQKTNYEGYRVEKSNTGNQPAIQVFNSGSGAAIQIANNANGKDIDGNSWEVSNAGAGTFTTVTATPGQLGAYVVEDASVSTVTSYNISGLDGNSDLMYKLLISGEYFATAATDLIVAKPNNDTSAANYQSYCRDESCTHGGAFGAGNYDLSTSAGLPLIRAAYAGTMWVMAELTFGGEAGKQRMAMCMSSLHSLDNVITLNEHVSSIWHDTSSNITSLYLDFSGLTFTGRIQLIKYVI